jgi:hypothetical protein
LKLSAIARLLGGDISPQQFVTECGSELAERRELIGSDGHILKRGSVVPVRVTDDCAISVSRQGVALICRHFVRGDLSALDLAYIADALQLAEDVSWEDEDVAEWVAEFTDPEINGAFTTERAAAIVGA